MSTMLYVVTGEDIDLAKIDFPKHISADAPAEGYGNICVVRCGGVEIESGYQAIKAAYPEAEKTTLKREALRLAHSMRGGRLQIASNVSAETKAQVDQLTALGYSVRDVVTLGIEMLHQNKVQSTKPPVEDLIADALPMVAAMREQDLTLLEDAIRIRRNVAMAERLAARGIQARAVFQPAGAESPWYPSYVLVYHPDPGSDEQPGTWATLNECRRLLDTVANLSPVEAYRRWVAKVLPEEMRPYTEADALRDTREARAQLRRDLENGKITSEMYSEFYRGTSFMDLVER